MKSKTYIVEADGVVEVKAQHEGSGSAESWNPLIWLLSGAFWLFLGFCTSSIGWFSVVMFVVSSYCFLVLLLFLAAMLVRRFR